MATTALSYIKEYKGKALKVLESIPEDAVAEMISILRTARDNGRTVFICGNGGSASTASHFANDLGKGASFERENRFRVIALTDNLPWITALANDSDYSRIFVEQLKNFAESGDVLIAISGSGNSPNVIEAVNWANDLNLKTIGLTGRPGGELGRIAQYPIFVESPHMGRTEEGHFFIQHLVGYFFMETES